MNHDIDNLKDSEKYIIQSIKDNKVILKNDSDLRNMIQSECLQDQLITKLTFNGGKLLVGGSIFFCFFMALYFFMVSGVIDVSDSIIQILGYIAVGIFIILFITICLFVAYNTFILNKNRWKLTDNGNDIYIKLIGLKKFLSDFSVIDKRKIEEILLWNDYLIYSVMFDLNKDIISDYKDLIVVLNSDLSI